MSCVVQGVIINMHFTSINPSLKAVFITGFQSRDLCSAFVCISMSDFLAFSQKTMLISRVCNQLQKKKL